MIITGEQIKAARKLLGWSQMTLALEANMATQTVANIEKGEKSRSSGLTVSTVKRTLEQAGIEFRDGEPPRLKPTR
ncbi:MAG TPA: helix-turn-helix domain-containing protein [Roseiarcus sp.]|nr:helix-turn-helix domain-containing protein [Roseiarcus sp.]